MARIGLLTGGGDCPGLERGDPGRGPRAASRTRSQLRRLPPRLGRGARGDCFELTRERTVGILPRGGTILGTSRTNPFAGGADGTAAIREHDGGSGVDALIPIGGDDTLGVA